MKQAAINQSIQNFEHFIDISANKKIYFETIICLYSKPK